MKEIRFGIIGCGDVTEIKSGPAFQKVKGSKLQMVMRRDEEKLIDYAKRHQVESFTTDYKKLLENNDIDAVYIATPPKWHHFYTLEAAKHKKAVYVEKPMALTVKECEEMVEVCKQYNVPLFVAYYRRAQPKFIKVKQLIDELVIGEIRSFQYTFTCPSPEVNENRAWLFSKENAGGGLLYDIGSHMVDILLFFFGEVEYACGQSKNQSQLHSVNDVTSGLLTFENSVIGSLQLTFNGAFDEDKLIIMGSRGSIELSIMSDNRVILKQEQGQRAYVFENLEHVQEPMIEQVVGRLLGENELDITGISGLKTQQILEAFENSREYHK